MDETRLAALERRTADLLSATQAQRADLAGAFDAQSGTRRAELEAQSARTDQLAQGQDEIRRALDNVVGQLARPPAGGDPADALDRRLEGVVQALTERLDARDAELRATIEHRAGEFQAAIDREAARSGAADEAQAEIRRRLTAVADRLTSEPASAADLHALEARVLEVQSAMEAGDSAPGSGDDELSQRVASVDARLGQHAEQHSERLLANEQRIVELAQAASGAEIEAMAARLQRLEANVETDLPQSLGRLAEQVAAASAGDHTRVDEELRAAHAELARRLEEVSHQHAQATAQVDARLRAEVVAAEEGRRQAAEQLERRLQALDAKAGETAGVVAGTAGDAAKTAGDAAKTAGELRSFRAEIGRRLDEIGERAGQVGAADLEDLGGRLRAVEAQITRSAGSAAQRLDVVERQIRETAERMTDRTQAQSELRVALEARVEALDAVVAGIAGDANAEATAAIAELRRRIDDIEGRMQAGLQTDAARSQSEVGDLRDAVAQLTERLDELAETTAAAVIAGGERIGTLDQKIDSATSEFAVTVEDRRREIEAGFRRGQAGAAVGPGAPTPSDLAERLDAVAKQAERSLHEVEDLTEFHSALDAGLGTLRSEIAAVRSSVKRVADGQAGLEERMDALLRASPATEARFAWGRKAKRGDASQAAAAVTEELLREHRELRDQVASLSRASEGAIAAAARASSVAASLGPLRREIDLLRQELAAQQEALAGIRAPAPGRRSPRPAAPAPAARKRAPSATED